MIRFEDVKDMTTEEYFNGNQFAIDVFNKKYKTYETETYVEAIKRVCDNIAEMEHTSKLQKYWSDRWFNEIFNDYWHPGGSIIQGAGSGRKISLANCTTLSLGALDKLHDWDNLESIIKNASYTVAKTAAYRQGLGIDFSKLRPAKAIVHNSSNKSSGVTHWMKLIDSLGYFVGQEGRIPAMLFSLNIDHPDIPQFIDIKKDYTQIQNANISVQMTDDFYKAVEDDTDWVMQFTIPAKTKGSKTYIDSESATSECKKDKFGYYLIEKIDAEEEIVTKTMNAKKLLELISKAMLNNAEPGIQNIDTAKEFSNSDALYDPEDKDFDSRIISTNACSEQYLNREGLCVLASLNGGKFDGIGNLEVVAESMVRFLDNVNEYELRNKTYATDYQRRSIENLRRVGCGITNLAGYIFNQGFNYGTDIGNQKASYLIEQFNYFLYKATIAIGKEKGSYKYFNKEKIRNSKFIQHMETFDLKFDSMRNVCVSSIAPTGTLSLMFREMVMGYGIEPSFGPYYWKRARLSGDYKYYFIIPKAVKDFMKRYGWEGEFPFEEEIVEDTWDGERGKPIAKEIDSFFKEKKIIFKRDTDINAFDKLSLMKGVMQNVDSSISVTYNLPQDTKWENVYDFIIKANEAGVKSVSVFPDKKMYGIVSSIPFKKLAFDLKSEGVSLHSQNFTEVEANELSINDDNVSLVTAPKRPKRMEADIYSVTVKGEKFVLAVGLLNGAPYEMFGGHMNGLNFNFNHREGHVEKIKRGIYKLEFGDISIDDFNKQFTPVEALMFRMLSLNMRHGVPIKYIVDQLTKASDDIVSFSSAAARVLKKYIVDGEKATGVECPTCHKTDSLVYKDGCAECSVCNWSKC